MYITEIRKNFEPQFPKEILKLNKSPIGKINCSPDEFLSEISDFKKTAIPIKDTYRELILNSGEKVIRSEWKTKNGFQLLWEKIFNTDKKLVKENFIDIFNKTAIEYAESTGKMKLLEASTPKGIVKYIFG